MARLQIRLHWVIFICVVIVGCVNCARDQKANNTITKQHREKKAYLVKKHLKRLKKPEGLVRLLDGRGDYEGMIYQVIVHYSAHVRLRFYVILCQAQQLSFAHRRHIYSEKYQYNISVSSIPPPNSYLIMTC
jgi:hypothetical protein